MIAASCDLKKKDVETFLAQKNKVQKPNSESKCRKSRFRNKLTI
nr:hypothetical protein [Mycoplasmopsis bovis]